MFPSNVIASCSFAMLIADQNFAVTGNLMQHAQSGMVVVDSQENFAGPSDPGVLLHSSW